MLPVKRRSMFTIPCMPNSEYTDRRSVPAARIRRKQKSAAAVGVSQNTLSNWERGVESNDESVNPFVPDYRVSIPRFLSLACLSMMRLRLA